MSSHFLIENQVLLPGIIGGVGPLSHTDFERALLRLNNAAHRDQDHPVYLLANATVMPDRTKAIQAEKAGDQELAQQVEDTIVHFADLLAGDGADFFVIICNTSHYWYDRVKMRVRIPWLNMMYITSEYVHTKYPNIKKVGILATDGTIGEKLYHSALVEQGLEPVSPDVGSLHQQAVMGAIYDAEYGIKATGDIVTKQAQEQLVESAHWLVQQGAQVIIAGCTEISVGLRQENLPGVPIIDPLHALAQTVLDLTMGRKPLNE